MKINKKEQEIPARDVSHSHLNPPNARLCGKQKQKKQMIITTGKRKGRHQQGLRFL